MAVYMWPSEYFTPEVARHPIGPAWGIVLGPGEDLPVMASLPGWAWPGPACFSASHDEFYVVSVTYYAFQCAVASP